MNEWIKTDYNYEGYFKAPSVCGLTIYEQDGKYKVILTELDNNPGTSVTNAVDKLACKVWDDYLSQVPVDDIQWYEHYEESLITKVKPRYSQIFFKAIARDYRNRMVFQGGSWQFIGHDLKDVLNAS